MIEKEKKTGNKHSTIQDLVRLDLSVMEHEGEYKFFVNEVTRVYEMGLFSRLMRDMDFMRDIGQGAITSIKRVIKASK